MDRARMIALSSSRSYSTVLSRSAVRHWSTALSSRLGRMRPSALDRSTSHSCRSFTSSAIGWIRSNAVKYKQSRRVCRRSVVLPAPNSVEGELIACCAPALRADVLIAGHHGSKTSSRTALLDRVGAYVFLVSAGPTKYASVTLPDQEVIDEFADRGTIYRTDTDDQACRVDPSKIETDNDDQSGGCHNVLVSIDPDGEMRAEVRGNAD